MPKAVRRTKVDWTYLVEGDAKDGNYNVLKCGRCGQSWTLMFPVAATVFAKTVDAFNHMHSKCEKTTSINPNDSKGA